MSSEYRYSAESVGIPYISALAPFAVIPVEATLGGTGPAVTMIV